MKTITKLKKEIKKIKKMGFIEIDKTKTGATGLKIEELLKINTGNFEIPDYHGIEIKTKSSKIRKNINLFNATPDSYLFEIKRLYNLYSYKELKDCEYKSLNCTMYCGRKSYVYNNMYFNIKVDYKEKKIRLIVTNINNDIVDDITSWSFDLLKEKLERKLMFLCYVEANKVFYKNKLYVKYTNDEYFKLKGFDNFIQLIDNGVIGISFKIGTFKSGKRKGEIHDHGTSFIINCNDLNLLFDRIW